jgi:4a-hydroxytetrahydrobiopterin dehydratase
VASKKLFSRAGFFQRVAEVAEHEGHHPDLHLVAYRHMSIEIWTHASNGLTENDFILAAKIDQLDSDLQNKTIALQA